MWPPFGQFISCGSNAIRAGRGASPAGSYRVDDNGHKVRDARSGPHPSLTVMIALSIGFAGAIGIACEDTQEAIRPALAMAAHARNVFIGHLFAWSNHMNYRADHGTLVMRALEKP